MKQMFVKNSQDWGHSKEKSAQTLSITKVIKYVLLFFHVVWVKSMGHPLIKNIYGMGCILFHKKCAHAVMDSSAS